VVTEETENALRAREKMITMHVLVVVASTTEASPVVHVHVPVLVADIQKKVTPKITNEVRKIPWTIPIADIMKGLITEKSILTAI
jgi:hypothetical protein